MSRAHHIAPTVRVCLADHWLLKEKLLRAAPDDEAKVRVANALREADECVRTACLAAGVVPAEAAAPAAVDAIRMDGFSVAPVAREDGPDAS